MSLQPTQNQILRFLTEFREGKMETTYELSIEPVYPNDPERSFLFKYCLKNGYIEETDRGRFRDYSLAYLWEGLLLAGKSPINRVKFWIEDYPTLWASICAVGGYMIPYAHEFLKKVFM